MILTIAGATLAGAAGIAAAGTPTHYKNCTAMHKVYKHGVGKPGAINHGGKVSGPPYRNAKLYNANSGLDRDKDGIACES